MLKTNFKIKIPTYMNKTNKRALSVKSTENEMKKKFLANLNTTNLRIITV